MHITTIPTAHRLTAIVCCLVFLPVIAARAAEGPEPVQAQIKRIGESIDRIEQSIGKEAENAKALQRLEKELEQLLVAARECGERASSALKKLDENLASLGKPVKGESADVRGKRAALKQERAETEQALASCKLLVLRSEELSERAQQLQKAVLAEQLLARGPSLSALLDQDWSHPEEWLPSGRSFVQRYVGLELLASAGFGLVALAVVAALLGGIAVRRRVLAWHRRAEIAPVAFGRFTLALTGTFAFYAPYLGASLAAAGGLHVLAASLETKPLIAVIGYGLPAYFFVLATVRTFFVPYPRREPLLAMDAAPARALARRLNALALVGYAAFVLFATLVAGEIEAPIILLVRGLVAAVVVANLSWALWLLRYFHRPQRVRWLMWLLQFTLLATLAAEWIGYRNLSESILRTVVGSLLALGVLLLANRLFKEAFYGIEHGRHAWQRRLRRALGLKADEHVPGWVWLRIIANTILAALFVLAILRIWGLSEAAMQQVHSYFFEGFGIGSLTVAPARLLLAVATFAVLIVASGWFKRRLDKQWLAGTRIDRGAREAIVTVSGYIGAGLAVIVGLGVAGVQFQHLAIIAGALSVGIGFGLQNVVNNFVSGLILLFERPIKTGDWIVVGETEGYVKRIRIRSTQIQTFDRADVIVPNSELISSQVTNWMLYDVRGRVRIPVGVAYGSDTEKVREVMLAVARDNPKVINDDSAPDPRVLFRRFGDSALEFELFCYIYNIDNRLTVTSELNFAIDKAFRENGIEIPFPQRDIHIRSDIRGNTD